MSEIERKVFLDEKWLLVQENEGVEEEQNKEDFNELDENFEVQDPLNNADMNDEQTELEDSTVMIKQEICEDAFEDNEDETDTTEEEEDFEPGKSKKCEPQELVNEDIPLIQIPSKLTRQQQSISRMLTKSEVHAQHHLLQLLN
mgnify:CR=1 FL=1